MSNTEHVGGESVLILIEKMIKSAPDYIFKSSLNAVKESIELDKYEIADLRDEVERLNNRITEMIELCLTVQEVNKIEADTIRDAAEKCKSIIRVDGDMLEICYPYTLKAHADKVESGI